MANTGKILENYRKKILTDHCEMNLDGVSMRKLKNFQAKHRKIICCHDKSIREQFFFEIELALGNYMQFSIRKTIADKRRRFYKRKHIITVRITPAVNFILRE